MKKLVATTLATVGLALGTFAQGSIVLDNSRAPYGIALDTAGNYYSGPYGLELWVDNAAAVPAGINGSSDYPYWVLQSSFKLEGTFAGQTMSAANPGVFQLGAVTMNDITAHASSAVIGLVAWASTAASSIAAINSGAPFGVVAFLDSSIADPNPVSGPPGVPSDLGAAWTTGDLVMTIIPETSAFALAGLGAATLLMFRRNR